MLISAIQANVLRYVGDAEHERIYSDTFLPIFNNAQQSFCRQTKCLVAAVSLLAPPNIDYTISFNWEEAFASGSIWNPWFHTSSYAAAQPFELSGDHDLAGDGNTMTSGVELHSSDPQHPVPFFFPEDCYAPIAIFWDYKWLEQLSWNQGEEINLDGWHHRGGVVDHFAVLEELNRRGFVTKSIPYDVGAGTNEATAVDAALVANMMYVIYYQIPERAEATSESIAIPEPWGKYLEHYCLWRYFSLRSEYANPLMAQHFRMRYNMGVQLVTKLGKKRIVQKVRRLGGTTRGVGRKPAYPRLPDHYPKLRLR